jgi:acyl carrier protein
MNKNDIVIFVIKICAEVLKMDGTSITESTNLTNDSGMDSLRLMEIIVRIQRHYKINLDVSLAKNFINPLAIADCIYPIIAEKNKKSE